MPGLDARFRNYDAATRHRNAGDFARGLLAADGAARDLSPGGAGQREGISRDDIGDGLAAIDCFRPQGARGHAGGVDLSSAVGLLRPRFIFAAKIITEVMLRRYWSGLIRHPCDASN